MKKILFIFGTRPEIIKLAPVISAFKKDRFFKTIAVSTGQHRQMLDQSLRAFGLSVDDDLNIMIQDQTLFDVTANSLRRLRSCLERWKPDMVVVQGDTTTAFCAALASFYFKIPVAHVEAGLRSFDLANPYPEEANRVFIDRIASLYFPPTEIGRKNLLKEGVPASKIFVTGNTVVDALRIIAPTVPSSFTLLGSHSLTFARLILLTAHRRENFGKPLKEICKAVRQIVRNHKDTVVLYPVHLNPHVQKTVRRFLSGIERVILTEPLSYMDLLAAMKRSYFILTDSGGIQEEAPSFGKPVLVLRKLTERPEAVLAGCAKVVGSDRAAKIVLEASRLLRDRRAYERMARVKNPFGDGHASERILKAVRSFFGVSGA